MKEWLSGNIFVYIIGLLAQIFFSSRLLVQWLLSEKAKKVVNPSIFWIFSLIAAILLFIYGYLRNDFAIILGQTLTYFIYIRNMQLKGLWHNKIISAILLFLPVIFILFSLFNYKMEYNDFFKNKNIPVLLLMWGSLGQIIFTFRFVYQWIYSEIKRKSVLPLGFWLISLIGSMMILSYAIIRKDPILFLGQSFGAFVYLRNILIGKKEKNGR